ncbi:MAG TPA: TolC family protein [Kofleriaceae bacterium]|nr:TolC family protein [Kofleriaceae bacterium]
MIVCAGVLIAGARAAAAEPAALRLADVIAVAVRQSPELERARIDVAAARAQLLRAEGSEDTHLGAKATGLAVRTRAIDGAGEFEQREVTVEASARRTLPTGGTLSISAIGDRNDGVSILNGVPIDNTAVLRYSASVIVELAQPLLRGAGPSAFEAPIRQAARQKDASALAAQARARDLVVSLIQAYWEVAFAWRQLEVRKASLELAEKQLAYTEGAIRSEKVARSEALAVQEAIAVRKQDVIAAEQEVYERSLVLRQLGGLEIGPDAIAVQTEPLPEQVTAGDIDIAAVVREAYAHSAELAGLEAARQAAEIGAAAADDAARSRLDLDVAGGPQATASNAGTVLSRGLDPPGYSITASLTLDHAIERRTERGGQQAARAALLAARVSERDARARLAVRATRAVQRARAALASIALAGEAIALAEQNIVAEQKRFELGKSTNFEVLRRQDELEQARLRHAIAVSDYALARADLDGLSGTILARYGIVMP